MKRARDLLVASAGFLVLGLTLAYTASGRAIAQEFLRVVGEVRITNTDPIPVASSPVNPVVTKATLAIVDTFQKQVTITLDPPQIAGTASFTVPGSKLLAIESLSGFVSPNPPPGNQPFVRFATTANGDRVSHFVFDQPAGGGWFLSAPGYGGTVAYADPGSAVEVLFVRQASIGTATMTLTLTGHFIDQ